MWKVFANDVAMAGGEDIDGVAVEELIYGRGDFIGIGPGEPRELIPCIDLDVIDHCFFGVAGGEHFIDEFEAVATCRFVEVVPPIGREHEAGGVIIEPLGESVIDE